MVFTWLAKKAFMLAIILVVLGVGAWFRGELKRANDLEADRVLWVEKAKRLAKEIAEIKRETESQTQKLASGIQNLESILIQREVERQALWDAHWWARKIWWSEVWIKLRDLDKDILALRGAVEARIRAKDFWDKRRNELAALKEREREEVEGQIADASKKIGQSYIARIIEVVRQELPIALGILVGIVLAPIGIKAFLYFVVAQWAAGCPPICILPSATGRVSAITREGDREKVSEVSVPIVLGEHQELLIQPDYLQSTSLRAKKSTKWLLNPSIPLSSLLSGMFLLTRITPSASDPVVISATKDPNSEIGIIDLGPDAAFVCEPRCLAGVIQDRAAPVRITRHWRLGSLHGWLTLQLRFLVFHGPGQLIVKGCRGIRVESANPGRLINQAATLGFSANLAYANTRCETFVSYWTGKEDLFNDLFNGEPGVYAYEEIPDAMQKGGISGRGLQGIADAILKVFGV